MLFGFPSNTFAGYPGRQAMVILTTLELYPNVLETTHPPPFSIPPQEQKCSILKPQPTHNFSTSLIYLCLTVPRSQIPANRLKISSLISPSTSLLTKGWTSSVKVRDC
jgi:hypothetical protein